MQPRSSMGTEERRNAEDALVWLDQAAEAGADLVVFPEGYPGPASPANDYDAMGPLSERAARRRLHVVASRIEPAEGGGHHMTLHLIGDSGETIGVYRRTVPLGPYIYHDIDAWKFDYVAADAELAVYETRLGRIGLQVCSEVFATESSRVLAIKGADMILYPAGGALNELLPSWRAMVWGRAIENLVYTVATQNIYFDGEQGVATVAGPEQILAQSADPGLLLADLDLDRLEFLRTEDERIEFPKRYRTMPGIWRWRRPELYGPLLEEGPPQTDPVGGSE
ncbi:MAG: carbon-nitrogen hydrolase family protein [Dehalococcoidia bacterium]